MPKIKLDVATQQIEVEEQEPEVVITDRAHHMPHMSEQLNWQGDGSVPPESIAFDYAFNLYFQRHGSVDYLFHEVQLLETMETALETLQLFPWFKKMLKVIVQSSFTGKFHLDKQEILPTWDTLQTFLIDFLAYIVDQTWPEYSDKLLITQNFFDKRCVEDLTIYFKTDLTDVNAFLEANKESIRNSGVDITKFMIQTMLFIFENKDYRTGILPILFSAPIYLHSIIDSYIKDRKAQLDYYKDIGVEIDKPVFENTWQFNTMEAIVGYLRLAHDKNPNDYAEFTNYPGAICETAGKPETEFGRHCLRKDNADGDDRYLLALKIVVEDCPDYADSIILEMDAQGKVTSAKVTLALLKDPNFIATVEQFRTEILSYEEVTEA